MQSLLEAAHEAKGLEDRDNAFFSSMARQQDDNQEDNARTISAQQQTIKDELNSNKDNPTNTTIENKNNFDGLKQQVINHENNANMKIRCSSKENLRRMANQSKMNINTTNKTEGQLAHPEANFNTGKIHIYNSYSQLICVGML
jgi:hypothetical protein